MPPDMEGICKYYIEETATDNRKRGGPHIWGLNVRLTSHHRKTCYEMSQTALEWRDSLGKQTMLSKMDMRFGTWNERCLYRAGTLMTVVKNVC
jgi:hypothetical protein